MTYDYGRFVWFELMTPDTERAIAFYGEVIGWKVQTMTMPGGREYSMFVAGETPVGGCTKPPLAEIPPHWASYASVADVDATGAAIVKAGGKALMDAFDIPNIGRAQPVADPSGAAFFLFHAEGEDRPAATGEGSFHWNELLTAEPEAAVAFYEKTLGYTHETMDMPNGTYFVLKNGEAPRGGVVAPETKAASHWQQYVTLDDCDAAVQRAEKNGGEIMSPAADVPGVGRVAVIKDPTGAVLGLITPAAQG